MPEIRDIGIGNLYIRDINIPRSLTSDPGLAIPAAPPVTTTVGTPIVNMPGCDRAHKDNSENVNLKDEDDKGVMTLCDAGTPSFSPIDYDATRIKLEQEPPKPPPIKPPAKPEPPEAPTPQVPKTEAPIPECPTREQQLKNPVGKILEGNKKITGYEMVGKECLMVTENLSIPDQIIGNVPTVGTTTATIAVAVTATTSALLAKPLADLLLKAVKPTVKKVLKKIAALRGKKIPPQSVQEKRQEQRIRNHAIRKLKGKE